MELGFFRSTIQIRRPPSRDFGIHPEKVFRWPLQRIDESVPHVAGYRWFKMVPIQVKLKVYIAASGIVFLPAKDIKLPFRPQIERGRPFTRKQIWRKYI